MSTVLYIKASPRPQGVSRTLTIADKFIEAYRAHHPDDQIISLDLYRTDIHFLSQESQVLHKSQTHGEWRDHPVLKYAYQFAEVDKYVFAEPLWNLGVPAILKAYMDYVCVNPITFKYTAEGPVGLCQGKKALNITTRGGEYSAGKFAAWEMGDKYLRTIMGFLGVTDFTTLAADKLDMVGQDVEAIVAAAIQKAQELAPRF
jgi:FMN-dependent NADH-azoreductase